MSQCLVPNWNLKQQRQVEGEEGSSSSHVHKQQNDPATIHLVPMSNFEVAELVWENGQLAMHGLSGLMPAAQTTAPWSRTNDMLESIVHQATSQYQNPNANFIGQEDHPPTTTSTSSTMASARGKPGEGSNQVQMLPVVTRKRTRSDSNYCRGKFSPIVNVTEECIPSACACACASASATFCRDNDTTMMTWASLDSDLSLKRKTFHEDSACHCGPGNQDRDTKVEVSRSNSTRSHRSAAIHNQSERRRRDRINQKMKALQRLVPNASKTDKASMLDEVIEYLKQLQAQIQMMSTVRNMPHMMMPLAMQQQLHMTMLARMGAGLSLGMGMLDTKGPMSGRTAPVPLTALNVQPTPLATPPFVAATPFMVPLPPHAAALAKPDIATAPTNASVPSPDPYNAILAQSINLDLLNNMAALYRQQMSQNNQAMTKPSQLCHSQGD